MDGEIDHLEYQYLAGGSIINYPPIWSANSEHLLFISDRFINIYSTISGQLVRKLESTNTAFIDFTLELNDNELLVACTSSGTMLTWEWRTGKLKNTLQFKLAQEGFVTNFKILNLYGGQSDLPHAFILEKIAKQKEIMWHLVDRGTGERIVVPSNMHLKLTMPLMEVDNKNFPWLVIAQNFYVYFVNYRTWEWTRLKNAHEIPITTLKIHPTEECVATGDEHGKIFLWRQFTNQKIIKTSLYHWHHTAVTSISFTTSGANFYSSGEESVLVKWKVDNPETRQFIPRMVARILHVVTSPDSILVAVCTADNGVQLVGTEKKIHRNLQEFTYVADDKTKNNKFPTGLRLNPRTNTLVMNGRTGSLQFYNTYTKSLLYNLNVIQQNALSMERDRILYDLRVTKAAFNIDWMATGEVFNDEQHLPELRLKFWKYQEETQNYVLNTNIELPHEGGFKAIEFSNDYQVDNLLCATLGEDNIIRIWCLEESDNIYKKGKTWYCIAQASYKNLPADSISFSQDGSLIAAGYGNTLCIFKSDNLKLKAALTGATGKDGCVSKAQIRIPSKSINGASGELREQRKKIMKLFSNMLDNTSNDDETLIKELHNTLKAKKSQNTTTTPLETELDDKQKSALYSKILKIQPLSLFQKVLLYQKLGITCNTNTHLQKQMTEYLGVNLDKGKHLGLHGEIHRMNVRDRFKAKYRLHQYVKRKTVYDAKISQNLISTFSLLNLTQTTKQKKLQLINGSIKQNKVAAEKTEKAMLLAPPGQTLSEISRVQFASGKFAHLVVVCTERRMLIWNLLTLRLQSVLKISVEHLTFDPETNLIAVVTKNNELHVFQPNVPLPIYQKRDIPNLYGIAWIPRRYPKNRNINVDWQTQSTLYFLTKNQEIIYLEDPNRKQADVPPPIIFDNAPTNTMNYSTFGTYATQTINGKKSTGTTRQTGPLILGNAEKSAVKALIDMSAHTMPPMSLICESFIKSMVKPVDTIGLTNSNKKSNNDADTENRLSTRLNGDSGQNGYGTHSDDDDDDDNNPKRDEDDAMQGNKLTNGRLHETSAYKLRKELLTKTEELKRIAKSSNPSSSAHIEDAKFKQLGTQLIQIDL